MARLHRLRTKDQILFVAVNLRNSVQAFGTREYRMTIDVLEALQGRFGFLLCGYVLMPDHFRLLLNPELANATSRCMR